MPSIDRSVHHPHGAWLAGRRARAAASRWRRDGSEARWARSDLRLRRLLSTIFDPIFTAAGVLFTIAALRAADGTDPSPTLYAVPAAVCFVMAAVTIIDLYMIRRGVRAQHRWHRAP
ncbi:hypothetical protein [Streptomyces sp. H27-H5]|uniref:hypothetical protein n=1 Tax=Streptomyces sp. H27-H5 TaxID=2996460 RepID=UPI00226DC46E|nr:hypothetical protein [Streptomyces sp. H27-H5]MCY0962898.1 hypothetical protein [Streptomyces sp. H27-H5]